MYKIMSNNLSDYDAINQIKEIDKVFNDNNIVIMPDYHSGKGCVVGTTMLIKDKVCVNHVGVDLNCGIAAYKIDKRYFNFTQEKLKELDEIIRKYIPSGTDVNQKTSSFVHHNYEIKLKANINKNSLNRAYLSLGTLGGGNHFIEVDENENYYYLFVHSGSRNLGLQVAKYWNNVALNKCNSKRNEEFRKILQTIESTKREEFIKEYKKDHPIIPNESVYLTDDDMKLYLEDVKETKKFAELNREIMIKTILKYLNIPFTKNNYIECTHNYIDEYKGLNILRKGATSAKKGEKVIIPINMRDGVIIGIGKGNPEWNYSAPHGAGRILSRKQAKETLSLDEFKTTMKGIYTTSVNENTLDESPMAYKPIEEILSVIGDTIEIEEIVKPIYNFKAGE